MRRLLLLLSVCAACHEATVAPSKPVCQTKALTDTTTAVTLIVTVCVKH